MMKFKRSPGSRCRATTASISMLAALASVCGGCAGNQIQRAQADAVNLGELATVDSVYRLGLGDKVRVDVFGEANLSGEFTVSGTGALAFPLVGDVPATGLTAQQLQDALARRLADGYLRDPKVTVAVLDFRPFFILGEVERPGRYPTVEGVTVLRAIATAGGFTYRANTKRVFIRRRGESQERELPLNADIPVAPGDVLRVGERYF